jgi:hypothetical protein
MWFVPLGPTLFLGAKADVLASFGDVPFYLRPFVNLRGVQAASYQGEHVAQLDLEARWQLWRRFSLVGFVGAGVAWNDLGRFRNSTEVVTGRAGLRYELARKYGLHVGVDVGFGPTDPIV